MKYKKILAVLGITLSFSLVGCSNHVDKEISYEIETSIEEDIDSEQQSSEEIIDEEQQSTEKTEEEELKFDEDFNCMSTSSITEASRVIDKIYDNKNTLFSPLSLNMALGMVNEGANNNTKEELNTYLGRNDYNDYARYYINHLKDKSSENENSKYNSKYLIANSIWTNKDIVFKEDYINTLKNDYFALTSNIDTDDAENSSKMINDWVDENTNGLIKKIISPSNIQKNTSAILVNTVYFEDSWFNPWSIDENFEFTNINGEKIKTTGLYDDDVNSYYENNKAIGFSKSYNNGIKFIGILPKEKGEFNVADLNIEELLETESYNYEVKAFMPKFKYESTKSLSDVIKEKISSSFDSKNADFSNISEKPSYISDILQSCKIELDEEGTKAAAATSIIMTETSSIDMPKEIKEVILDRPFVYMIIDDNNEILFIGKFVECE